MGTTETSYQFLLYKKALAEDGASLAPVFLDARVLDRYRKLPDFSAIRTDTIGRLKKQGGWSLDFGISPQEGLIHISLGDMASNMPPDEREHWVKHIVSPPMSQSFVKTRISPGACIEDGETRSW